MSSKTRGRSARNCPGVEAADPTLAQRFLDLLERGGVFTFQTFDDTSRKSRKLAKILHGTLADHVSELVRLNKQGAGVFVTVNATDGTGRTEANIVAVRAVFVDLDGSPLGPITAADPHPSCVIATSPGRFHAYWLTSMPLDRFRPTQEALAARFAADPSVVDLPRVMRLPGFLHRKGEPTLVSFVEAQGRRYSESHIARLVSGAPKQQPQQPQQRRAAALPGVLKEGIRNRALTSLAGTLRARGCDREEIAAMLAVVNRSRCRPPLDEGTLNTIARSISKKPAGERIVKKKRDPMRWLRG